MDGFRDYPSEFDVGSAGEATTAAADVEAAIGGDERRMHVRAYNYWVSLLDGRDYPSIEDLEPADLRDFADHSVLLDFTCGRDNPGTQYIGASIRTECGLGEDVKSIADVPSRSLLSRLTDHYMQIIANRAPVGFEAEFHNQRGEAICYRGILMPFSSDGDTIDFIYGVINWKLVENKGAAAFEPIAPVLQAPEEADADRVEEEAEPAQDELQRVEEEVAVEAREPFAWELPDDAEAEEADQLPELLLDEDAGLADRLCAARETAEAVKAVDGRSRVALYQALSLAYDFALASGADPEGYAELLEESGMKAQARAPMTPVVKLVFGVDYDKARLTEFAAALSFAQRQQVATGEFLGLVEKQSGGLKALVAAERQARRPESRADSKGEEALRRLRAASPIALVAMEGDEEFALVVTRRRADGGYEAVAVVADPGLLGRAIRRAAT